MAESKPAETEPKRGYLVDWESRGQVKAAIAAGDPLLNEALKSLIEQADAQLTVPIRPVTAGKEDGTRLAPSGDPHDYVSLSPYWWPDPNSPDGLPYTRRDGEINPERAEYDTSKLGAMGKAVRTLGFAYYMTGDERYAERATEHLRAWFVQPETRMNPSLRFAQFVPGVSIGRAVGIIDTNRLRWVPDAIVMISESPAWSESDDQATRAWFGEFLDWLITSDLGIAEANAKNNHGTWHSAQACLYALVTGRHDIARSLITQALARVDHQFEPDGRQPHELARTRALDYTDFNIRGYTDIAAYGQVVGIDVLGYKGPEGQSILGGLDWAVPYFTGDKDWKYKQISPPKRYMYFQTLRRAGNMMGNATYLEAARRLTDLRPQDRWMLLILPETHRAAGAHTDGEHVDAVR
ncbi:MAG: alginate lyase family protein [Planctomycetota bacterium]